jgi:hypothetical protein
MGKSDRERAMFGAAGGISRLCLLAIAMWRASSFEKIVFHRRDFSRFPLFEMMSRVMDPDRCVIGWEES